MKKQEKSKSKEIEEAASILKNGGIIIFPTDTVYGIGCRSDNPSAINRLYHIKGTPKDQPFPILVSNTDQVAKLAKINNNAEKLMAKYWPGALTIILRSKKGASKIGFRMPDSNLVQSLIDKIGVPIIGTSANFHGKNTPSSFEELDPQFIKLADFTVKGKCQKGIESTVVDTTINPPKIIRQGAVDINSINQLTD